MNIFFCFIDVLSIKVYVPFSSSRLLLTKLFQNIKNIQNNFIWQNVYVKLEFVFHFTLSVVTDNLSFHNKTDAAEVGV